MSAYADDLVLFCKDKYDQDYIFSFFDEVSLATGSTLNKSKTNILHIGPKPFSSVYQRTNVKIFGIHFDFQNNGVLSFKECEPKIDKRIQKYKHLPLTLHGKVLICNTMLFPLLFYAAAHTCLQNHSVRTSIRGFFPLYGEKGNLSQSPER